MEGCEVTCHHLKPVNVISGAFFHSVMPLSGRSWCDEVNSLFQTSQTDSAAPQNFLSLLQFCPFESYAFAPFAGVHHHNKPVPHP